MAENILQNMAAFVLGQMKATRDARLRQGLKFGPMAILISARHYDELRACGMHMQYFFKEQGDRGQFDGAEIILADVPEPRVVWLD